jgi:hypothetical protein
VSPKRHLPVLPSAAEPSLPERPAWQWGALTAGLFVMLWLVLALLFTTVVSHLERHASVTPDTAAAPAVVVVALGVASLAGSGFASGWVVGAWGPRSAVAIAAASGGLVGVLADVLTFRGPALADEVSLAEASAAALVIVVVASAAAALGAWRGGKKRHASDLAV